MRTILLSALCASSLALAADGGAEGPAEGATDKAAPEKTGPDVSKLPFNQTSVFEVVKATLPKIQDCYNQMNAAKGGKPQEGKISAHWVITPEGIVKGAKIVKKGTTLKDPKLHECVVAVLLTMEFPKPAKDSPIDFPFNLKAEK